MRQFILNESDDTMGADPKIGLYAAINRTHIDLGLTLDNSKVVKLIASATPNEPNRTFVRIQKGEDIQDYYDFYYDRININTFIKNPFWFTSELDVVKNFNDSASLLNAIAQKVGCNLREEDFWVSPTSIDYSGGETTPNFVLRCIYNNVYYHGEINLWLHSGQVDEPILN